MLQVKRFQRNDRDSGTKGFFKDTEPIEMLDNKVNEFCRKNKIISVNHFPPTDYSNQYYIIIYEEKE